MKKKILIIDDEPEILEVLSQFLEEEGYKTATALNGQDGLTKFKEEKPDLVLLDMAMAHMNGLEVLRRIKEIDKEAGVIIVTGYADAEKVLEAFRLGAHDCIFKPFDFHYLIKSIEDKFK